jgi:hypothetical protein
MIFTTFLPGFQASVSPVVFFEMSSVRPAGRRLAGSDVGMIPTYPSYKSSRVLAHIRI